jgi:hypothetical protein
MNNFISNIKDLLASYETEIVQLKILMVNLKLRESNKDLLIKYSIPIFYSIWEGFFVKSLIEYINFINSSSISIDKIRNELLTHWLDKKINFGTPHNDFTRQMELVENIKMIFNSHIFHLNIEVDTKSNLNYKIANNILHRLCLNNLPKERDKELKKLLLFRNNIAHGECSIPINMDIIFEISAIVINCMYDLFILIEDGINNENFRRT